MLTKKRTNVLMKPLLSIDHQSDGNTNTNTKTNIILTNSSKIFIAASFDMSQQAKKEQKLRLYSVRNFNVYSLYKYHHYYTFIFFKFTT